MFAKYFSFSGRIGRFTFLIRLILMYIVVMLTMVVGVFGLEGTSISDILAGVIMLAFLISFLSLSIRRLHDLNLPGWVILLLWLPLIVGIPGLLSSNSNASMAIYINPFRFWPQPGNLFSPQAFLWYIPAIMFFLLFVWGGTNGPNRYGSR